MRIVLVGNTGWNVVHYRGGLLRALAQAGYEVLAVADFEDEEAGAAAAMGARTRRLALRSSGTDPLSDLLYMTRLWRLYRRERPDVVHHFTIKPVIYGAIAARLAGVPRIVGTVTGQGIASTGLLGRLVRLLFRLALGGRAITTFQNDSDRRAFLAAGLVDEARSATILGSGVDTAALRPAGEPPAGPPTFVMACRMLYSKGVAEFAEAARRLHREGVAARFVLIGGTREDYGSANPDFVPRDVLEGLNAEGKVEWRGRRPPDEVYAAMREASAVVLPSYYPEGMPRALLEAAALGVATVTCDAPGCRDAVIDGRTGFVCPPRDADALAGAMRALADDVQTARTLGANGRRLAEARFEESLVFSRYLELYAGRSPAAVSEPLKEPDWPMSRPGQEGSSARGAGNRESV